MSATLDRSAVTSDLRFHPATALIGADVTGIDLRNELDPGTVARLREGLLKHKVLFFRRQAIDDVQQIRFTRYFGAVTPAHPITNGLEELPEIKVNKLFGGIQEYASFRLDVDNPLRPLSHSRKARGWHIDITFVANPAAITVLRGVEILSYGGDTVWTDLEALYDGLSAPLKGFLDGLQAIHVRDDAANGLPRPPRFDGRPPGPFASLHPLVRVHPETGRKSLFLSTGFVKAIDGLQPSESAGPVDGPHLKEQRIVHRTTVGGDLPRGPNGFVSRPLIGELFNTIS